MDSKFRNRLMLILVFIIIVCTVLFLFLKSSKNTANITSDSSTEQFSIETSPDNLIKQFQFEDTDFVDVYHIEQSIVINTYSKFELDEPHQYSVDFADNINESDISVKWLYSNGKTADGNDGLPTQASIMIVKDGNTIFETKESFIENGDRAFINQLKN